MLVSTNLVRLLIFDFMGWETQDSMRKSALYSSSSGESGHVSLCTPSVVSLLKTSDIEDSSNGLTVVMTDSLESLSADGFHILVSSTTS